jgi:hypothetical protein
MLDIVLMSNEQVTVRTVAARLVQREQLLRINMDNQWELTLMRLVVALRAPRKPHILVRIKKEAIKWGLFPQLGCRLLFCHWVVVPPFT